MTKSTFSILTISFVLILSSCGFSQEDVDNKIDAAQESIIRKVGRAIDNCEERLNGLLMDESCLEETFDYRGDFYDCEVSPDFTVIDGECLRSELGI